MTGIRGRRRRDAQGPTRGPVGAIIDPMSKRAVPVDAAGRYLACRWCGAGISSVGERVGRSRKQCDAAACLRKQRNWFASRRAADLRAVGISPYAFRVERAGGAA